MSLIMMTRDGSSSSSSVVVEDPLPLVGHSHSHSPSLITLIIPHHHPHFPQPPSLPFYPLTFPNSFFFISPYLTSTLPLPYLTLPHPTLPYHTLPYLTLLYCVVPFPARHRHTHGLYLIRLTSPQLPDLFIHPSQPSPHTQTHTPDHNNEHENQAKCRPGRPRRAPRGQRRQRGRGVSVFFLFFSVLGFDFPVVAYHVRLIFESQCSRPDGGGSGETAQHWKSGFCNTTVASRETGLCRMTDSMSLYE